MAFTIKDKRAIIVEFVKSVLVSRVQRFHDEFVGHWKEVAKEIFDADMINSINAIAKTINGSGDHFTSTMCLTGYNTYNRTSIRDHILQEVHVLKDSSQSIPFSFTASYEDFDLNTDLRSAFDRMWSVMNDEENCSLVLDLPILLLVAPPNNQSSSSCSLTDDDEVNMKVISLKEFVNVPDCATERHFKEVWSAISKDAMQVGDELLKTIRSCRTPEAVARAVPQLEPFITCSEEASSQLTSLLDKIQSV